MKKDKEKKSADKILAIDTSSPVLAVSLAEGENILWECNLTFRFRHAEKIFEVIDQGLELLDWQIDDIQMVITGNGPGSFTGLRVGLAAVKGLASDNGPAVVCVSSLDVIAYNHGSDGDVLVIVDAKRKQSYSALFHKKDGQLVRKSENKIISTDEFIKKYADRKRDLYVYGDGVNVFKKECGAKVSASVKWTDVAAGFPNGAGIVKAGIIKAQEKDFTAVPQILPDYLRPSFAEEMRSKKK